LLDNSIRHTPSGGGVRVSINQSDSICEVVVADTGNGIPVEAQPHVFKRFYRVDKARSRSDINVNIANGAIGAANGAIGAASGSAGQSAGQSGGGAGLGLSIAQWVAEAHGRST